MAIMGNWFGHGKHGSLMGIWNSHSYIGNILGLVISSYFADINWYANFLFIYYFIFDNLNIF